MREEKMREFKHGDKVRIVKGEGIKHLEGWTGRVAGFASSGSPSVLVDFAENIREMKKKHGSLALHRGSDCVPDKDTLPGDTGWFFHPGSLVKAEDWEEKGGGTGGTGSGKPNIELSEAYSKAFDFFNDKLFDGALSRPMLCISRNSSIIGGYFSAEKWHDEKGSKIHEIAINANHMDGEDIVKLMHILIHEMTHQWQHEQGKPTRNGYHNKEWMDKALSLGFGGVNEKGEEDKPGQAVMTNLKPGGKAEQMIAEMPDDAIFPWMTINTGSPDPQQPQGSGGEGSGSSSKARAPRSGKRTKYTCPVCGLNVWAKHGVKILCLDCDKALIEQV